MVLTPGENDSANLVPSPESSATPLLPPCRICEERASGLHYGVNTCEACKGFFRRSLNRKVPYRCTGTKSCSIGPGKRNSCAYCRFQKCLEAGMSKDAIKTGRYTHEKRTRDIEEVRRLMGKEEPEPMIVESPMSASPCSKPVLKEEDIEVDSIVDLVVKASAQFDSHHHFVQLKEEVFLKQKQHYEHYKLQDQIFGTMNTLSKQEYHAFYEATGIDLDNRRQMVRALTVVMEEGIMRYIQFAKAIPEFETLSLDDQASLIKNSRFEYWFLCAFPLLNSDLQVGFSPTGKCFHVQEIARVWEIDFIKEVFAVSKCFQNLKLSVEEASLLKAIVITFSDRCTGNGKQVEEIQWKLVLCLKNYVEKMYPDEKLRFARIIGRVTGLRDLSEWNYKLANSLKMEWPEIQGSPLLYEILTL